MPRSLLGTLFAFLAPSALCLDTVNYGAFTQTATYSIANQLGLFQGVNLNVTYLQIPNSSFAYPNLLKGGYDVLTGTIDNAVNLRFNQNATVTVLGQIDAGPDIVIAATPDITSIQQLRGKSLIVDSPVSGYAYILRKVLSLYGLSLENGDYYFQTAGSTALRYQYLTSGVLPNGTAVYATILTYPFTEFARALPSGQRPTILARVSDFIQPFSSSAITVAEASLSDTSKRDTLKRFWAALYAASTYLATPENQDCAVKAIGKQLNVTSSVAQAEYAAATDATSGESISVAGGFNVSRQGLLNVIDVRGQFGGFASIAKERGFDFVEAIEPGVGKMIDYSVKDEALAAYGNWIKQVTKRGKKLCTAAGL
ncbi:hypothetical protein BKA67DRAFT_593694 [Truncatella angustata]|uniref:SsuA/THI5-like domain-containing protein n=1 Tax=Truncatella angustata TaxID=152316 RepID=A0A9P8UH79_9PEZI|nr:uncharacterized protein BKA67DRAFT_593694 [Truncatella angustata]KAH6652070.1 hypothetical protein BKA67DRAFT_593694 [Truncatella angustata]KAH8195764.1 hypothetical protein TruAng_010066 [Truncatella angustata]